MNEVNESMIDSIVGFLRREVKNANFSKVILGLSGGVDSAVVAVLCVRAFCANLQNLDSKDSSNLDSKQNLKVLLMPSLTSSKESIDDALLLCKTFDINYEIADIKGYDRIYCEKYGIKDSKTDALNALARGNFCARMRMATLYDYSQRERRLVIGTSNKSELLLGYGTLFGDLACALNPIGSLYKTQIFALAKLLNVPDSIIKKPPSADLFAGQSDEADIGYTYQEIDTFLEKYCEYTNFWNKFIKTKELEIRAKRNKTREELLAYLSKKFNVNNLTQNNKKDKIIEKLLLNDFPPAMVKSLLTRINNNAFKAKASKILKM